MCILIFFCFSLWCVFADTTLDNYISAIEAQQTTLSPQEQTAFLKKSFALLSLQTLRSSYNTEQLAIIEWLQSYFWNRITLLPETFSLEEPSSLISMSTHIPHVDMEQVRSAWLERHNQERELLWLKPLSYHLALESTATTWANYLGSIRSAIHRRTSSDGYYSYASIKQRFLDQWIIFSGKEQNGQSLFTENLWWNMYSCKKIDCTEDFIAAIKKSRDFFINEKWKSYSPHYNAIVGHYTSLWLGVALSGKKYYLVSHYTQNLQ